MAPIQTSLTSPVYCVMIIAMYLYGLMDRLSRNAGSTVSFKVEASETVQNVAYQIIARGSIIMSGEVDVSGTSATFQITSSTVMAPGAWIVVYYIRADDEVLADSKPFKVEGVFKNQVGINFSADKKKASEPVDLTVSADPNSFVGILVVDKSVQLLKSGYDIDKEEVLTELARWDLSKQSSGGGGGDAMPFRGWFPYVPDADSTGSIFKDAGLLVMSDAFFTETPVYFNRVMFAEDVMFDAAPSGGFPGGGQQTAGTPLTPVTHVRKLFPETWLWSDAVTNDGGSVTFQATVPDTITSWRATAFALNTESGFGVVNNAAELLAFQSFFVTLNMPYSIIRGEEFAVQALIFNYENDDLQTTVTLAESNDFMVREDVTTVNDPVRKQLQTIVTVPRQGSTLVSFWIVTEKLGQITVRVDAQTTVGFADAESRKLLVEPEGKPIHGSKGYFVNLNDGVFSQAFNVPFPTVGVVDGSQMIKVSVIGDIMGPALTGLDRFLRVPTGCGEQNMIGLVPNIFITKYLISVDALTPEIRDKAEANMAIGYQRELTYQHKDSSFSAFGDNDKSGSTWLTAFVLKSFKQAKPYVYVDDEILAATANWLVKQQVTSGSDAGSFNEPGSVCHKDMQGGVNSKQTITAYVLVSFLEERDTLNTPVEQAIMKGFDYLVSKISTLKKPYDVAVVTYAFAKYMAVNIPSKYTDAFNTLLQRLDSMAVKIAGETHWTAGDSNTADALPNAYWYTTPSNDIETTSYALLTYNTLSGRIADSMAVVKWLQAQRNSFGGYGSTQDTVIGLQALAEFAMSFKDAGSQNVMAGVSSSGSFSHTFDTITSANSILTYNIDVPAQETSLTLSASGSGVAMMMVSWQYNIDNSGTSNSISITVNDLSGDELDILKVEFCVRWLEQEVSGMVVTEFGIPSGYVADLDAINRPSTVKRMEVDDRTVNIYFDEVTNSQTCIQMISQRLMAVSGVKPSVVTAYSYYQIEKSAEAFYLPNSLGAANPCQVCGADCEGCPAFINKFPQAGAAPQSHGSYVTLFLSVCICILAGVITAV